MRAVRLAVLAMLVFVLSAGIPLSAQQKPSLYVYSTLDALMAGVYDGDLTVSELSAKGDFGLATFNHLDGEMIMLDGVCMRRW